MDMSNDDVTAITVPTTETTVFKLTGEDSVKKSSSSGENAADTGTPPLVPRRSRRSACESTARMRMKVITPRQRGPALVDRDDIDGYANDDDEGEDDKTSLGISGISLSTKDKPLAGVSLHSSKTTIDIDDNNLIPVDVDDSILEVSMQSNATSLDHDDDESTLVSSGVSLHVEADESKKGIRRKRGKYDDLEHTDFFDPILEAFLQCTYFCQVLGRCAIDDGIERHKSISRTLCFN